MGDKLDSKDLAKALHLRGNLRLRARAMSHDDAGVVDDTARTDALHELKGPIEKDSGLEACEGRIILDKELSGVTED